ncbi:MAG: PDZ domain-containing protein, partial [Bacteroidota bacterium]
GGGGERAGLREQDVILSVDGRTVNEANELQSYIAQRRLGDIVTLKIFREGKSLEKRVTLRAREDSEAVAAAEGDREEGEEPGNTETSLMLEELGMGVRSLTPEEKRRLEVPGGAAVESVKPYGEAFNRGMAAGDVILEADRKDVRSADDLRRIVEGRKKGDSMLLRVRRQAGGTTYVAVQIPR